MKEDAEGDPDVEQADAGDDAAHPTLRQEAGDGGPVVDPGVGGPDAAPGQQDNQGTDVEAKNDEEGNLDDLQPARNLPWPLGWRPGREGGCGLAGGAEEISLIRHPLPRNFPETSRSGRTGR